MGLPNFHHHPDGIVYVRTASGVYADTPENFALDLGLSYRGLPTGYIERYYEPNVKHVLSNHLLSEPQPLVWEDGDFYIGKFNDLMTAKAAREAAL